MTQQQKAYIAGFLDGDGSVYVKLRRDDSYRYGYQIDPYILFCQKKEYFSHLEDIKRIVKAGYMRIRKDGIAEYTIGDRKSLIKLAKNLLPFSRLKSRQLKLLLRILKLKEKKPKTAKEFIKLCQVVDKFKELNYSKQRIQTADSVRKLLIERGLITP